MAANDIYEETARRFDLVLWLALRARPQMLTSASDAGLNRERLEVGDVDALEQIVAIGPCPMSKVASTLRVDRSTVTRSVDRLNKLGLVERQRSTADARMVLVSATLDGLAAQTEASERRSTFACRLLEHLHPDDQDEVGRLWPMLAEAIGRVVGDAPTFSEVGGDGLRPPDAADGDRLRRNGAALGRAWRTMRRAKPGIVALMVGGRFEPRLEAGDVDTLDLVAAAAGRAQMSDIATGLGVAPSTASQAVARLVGRGLIVRARDADDGRVFRVSLTEAGHHAHEISRTGRREFSEHVIAAFAPKDQAILHRLLPLVADAVRREFVGERAATRS